MEKQNIEKYKSDTPISNISDDRFQRSNFAKKVSDIVIERTDPNSLVVGIYGSWGEGKTTVINFIENNLQGKDDIVICKFNPWKFKDESQLLSAFFNLLAKKLGQKIVSRKEKIIKDVLKYGEAVSDVSGIKASGLFKIFSSKYEIDIDEQKKRIEDILKKEKKKVAIFIDDIDRLERKEIQSIFRLIKLTADFQYTTYILSFDQMMVAKAIGENYEDGSQEAGRNFLEKIIQVPLQLPLAQTGALKDYCIERLNQALDSYNITVSSDDSGRFLRAFSENILRKINTPRMAVRYSNTVAFSIPILNKEVNYCDLMLIEAIKVFYPEVYDFVRSNPLHFIKSYQSTHVGLDNRENEERKKQVKSEFEDVIKSYPTEHKKAVKNLLTELFPIFSQIFHSIGYGENSFQRWHDEKRIGSPQYFHRYFAYTVLEGEISDVEYELFISNVMENNELEIKGYLSRIDTSSLVMKILLFKAESCSPELSKKLIEVFSKNADKFENNKKTIFRLDNPLGQLGLVIYKLLKNITDDSEKIQTTKKFITESISVQLIFDLFRNFRLKRINEGEDEIFNETTLDEISICLLERAKQESKDTPLFESYPQEASSLFSHIWTPILGKESLMDYLKPILSANPEKFVSFLKAYAPTVHSMGKSGTYLGGIEQRTYEWMAETFDIDYLYDVAKKLYPSLNENELPRNDGELDDQSRVQQFVYHYSQAKKNSEKEQEVIAN